MVSVGFGSALKPAVFGSKTVTALLLRCQQKRHFLFSSVGSWFHACQQFATDRLFRTLPYLL